MLFQFIQRRFTKTLLLDICYNDLLFALKSINESRRVMFGLCDY